MAPPLHRLTRQDAGYLRRETPAQPMHFVLLIEVNARPDGSAVTLDDVRRHVAGRLPHLPELRRRVQYPPLGIGLPAWADDRDFDIDRHITTWPVDTANRSGVLAALAAETATHVDRTRPLWRLRVGPALASGSTPLALSIHHALMDGGLLAGVLAALFGDDQAADVPPGIPLRASAARLLAAGLRDAVRHRLARPGSPPTRTDEGPPASGAALTGEVGPSRAAAEMSVYLADLRSLRRATGTTINDLYLAAITGGLRTLLQERGHDAADSPLLAMVPRNVRTEAEARAVGNRTWTMLVPLPVGEADEGRRLDAVQAATSAAKAADRSSGAAGFSYDIAVSNVILGSGHALAGAPIARYAATAPLQGRNQLLAVGMSYDDRFTIAFTADGDAFPDLADLAAHTREAFATLGAGAVPGLAS